MDGTRYGCQGPVVHPRLRAVEERAISRRRVYDALPIGDKAKLDNLFRLMADQGRIARAWKILQEDQEQAQPLPAKKKGT